MRAGFRGNRGNRGARYFNEEQNNNNRGRYNSERPRYPKDYNVVEGNERNERQ